MWYHNNARCGLLIQVYSEKKASCKSRDINEGYAGRCRGGGHCLFEGRYPLPNYRPAYGLTVPNNLELFISELGMLTHTASTLAAV